MVAPAKSREGYELLPALYVRSAVPITYYHYNCGTDERGTEDIIHTPSGISLKTYKLVLKLEGQNLWSTVVVPQNS